MSEMNFDFVIVVSVWNDIGIVWWAIGVLGKSNNILSKKSLAEVLIIPSVSQVTVKYYKKVVDRIKRGTECFLFENTEES